MKLIDAIRLVERPEATTSYHFSADLEALCQNLDIATPWESYDELDNRLKEYPIAEWLCTDTHVGLYALYFDGEAVGMTYQSARKNDKIVKWLSHDAAVRVRDAILSCLPTLVVVLVDEDEDIGDDLRVQYCGQSLTDDGFYEGRPVRALVWYDGIMGRTTAPEHRREGRSYFQKVDRDDPRRECVLVQDGDEQRVIPIPEFSIALTVAAE